MATTIKLTVNGKPRELHTDDPSMPLLYALRLACLFRQSMLH